MKSRCIDPTIPIIIITFNGLKYQNFYFIMPNTFVVWVLSSRTRNILIPNALLAPIPYYSID